MSSTDWNPRDPKRFETKKQRHDAIRAFNVEVARVTYFMGECTKMMFSAWWLPKHHFASYARQIQQLHQHVIKELDNVPEFRAEILNASQDTTQINLEVELVVYMKTFQLLYNLLERWEKALKEDQLYYMARARKDAIDGNYNQHYHDYIYEELDKIWNA